MTSHLTKRRDPMGSQEKFYKCAWPIIKNDIIRAFNAFWSLDSRSFHLLNDAYMILLRKKNKAQQIRDYRSISLMHSFGKLVAKCLATRLARVLDVLVRQNQSAFIRGRCLHDNFQTVQLTYKLLHSKKKACALIKVNIARAFDTVAWPFLLQVLEHLGFSRRWRNWISILLSTASTRVLLNGRPRHHISHACGLRQGDPLSPMLFVTTMEVLNGMIRWADQQTLFSTLGQCSVKSRISLYVDDTVLFIVP